MGRQEVGHLVLGQKPRVNSTFCNRQLSLEVDVACDFFLEPHVDCFEGLQALLGKHVLLGGQLFFQCLPDGLLVLYADLGGERVHVLLHCREEQRFDLSLSLAVGLGG